MQVMRGNGVLYCLNMLRIVNGFEVKATSSSMLHLKANAILDFYFELFVREMEYILNSGLVKKYRRKEENVLALKGRINFSKNIRDNLVHQERFHINHTVYDYEHKLHKILYKALLQLNKFYGGGALTSRIGNLLLDFPEMPDIRVSSETFDLIKFGRKTNPYKNAIGIARLILLQYHPDIVSGRNDVLALMFDMNMLWERYIYKMLKKLEGDQFRVRGQDSQKFWESKTIRPDIVILDQNSEQKYVIDTKWKLTDKLHPSDDDLKQMFAYNLYWESSYSMLLYPRSNNQSDGDFGAYHKGKEEAHFCKLGFVDVLDGEGRLKLDIGKEIIDKILGNN
jgi:5-methylcytosine-specific restriction enzyme subunit McrC